MKVCAVSLVEGIECQEVVGHDGDHHWSPEVCGLPLHEFICLRPTGHRGACREYA